MRQTKDIYRDACGRSHRILGAYVALWAWKKGVDCVALDRDQLFPYLGIEAMREQRLRWLAEDIKDFFPHQEALLSVRCGGHGSLYLSRRPFPDASFQGAMPDAKRVKLLSERGLRASVGRLPREEQMVTVLATAATGGGRPRFVRRKKDLFDWIPGSRTDAVPEAEGAADV